MTRLVAAAIVSSAAVSAALAVSAGLPSPAPPNAAARSLLTARQDRLAVIINNQEDSPARLSAETKWVEADKRAAEVTYTVENIGSKPIRAYAVRITTPNGNAPRARCYFNTTDKPGKILQPNTSAVKSTWMAVSDNDSQSSVEVAVDFVEFTDGSMWGPDICQSAELLDGLREGARAAKREFKKELSEKKLELFIRQLYRENPNLVPPQGHSDTWVSGFKGAINSLRERVRRANEEGGGPEVEAALQRPFDVSELP